MRPLPRYVLAIMAAFVAFELWIPLLAIVIRALVGPTVPTAVQAVIPLFGLAVPAVVGLALSDYLADRRGLVRPYQPKRRASALDQDEAEDELEDEGGERELDEEEQGPEDGGAQKRQHEDSENNPEPEWRHEGLRGDEGARDGRASR